MPDEGSTGVLAPDAATTSVGLFGDEEPSAPAEGAADEQAAEGEQQVQEDVAAEASASDDGTEATTAEELKVVVVVRGERAVVGVQRAGADPHIEAFDDQDLPALAGEIPTVVERAKARWEASPKHPAHTRPAHTKPAPAKRRQRGGQARAEAPAPQGGAEQSEALRLF